MHRCRILLLSTGRFLLSTGRFLLSTGRFLLSTGMFFDDLSIGTGRFGWTEPLDNPRSFSIDEGAISDLPDED